MTWQAAQAPVRVAPGDIHVWRANLADFQKDPGSESVLSEDETQRAGRFRVPQARARFTAARSLLRFILGACLECPPAEIRFAYRKHGKPFLAPGLFREDLRFNLSHSHGLALYAVCTGREVGIDLERMRADRDHERLAARFFSAREAARLAELPAAQRQGAFYHCWTRKEAYLKARGEGLAIPLGSFSVSLAPDEPAALLEVAGDHQEAGRWRLWSVDAGPDFAAALAAERGPANLRFWDWSLSPLVPPSPPGS
ncbi:MAG: 4'-phosphopantetheinyl transferase superfamily protein [Bryobacterales bacterium]|nr:4'-phosphopantetheinyl transferase superfamily protein [Bryobacterales bacterium]